MTKNDSIFYTVYVALIVSLGGFLWGLMLPLFRVWSNL
jgi:hypothetical protein